MSRWALPLLAVCLSALPLWAVPKGGQALQRARLAERSYDYVGTQVVRTIGRRQMQAEVVVAHLKRGITCHRFTSPPPMAGHRSFVTPHHRMHFTPGPGRWSRVLPQPEATGNLPLLLRNYHLLDQGTDTVAGRTTHVFLVQPRRPGNPSKRLWLDQDTGLLLKSVLRNWQGKPVSEMEFREIKIARDLPEAAQQCRRPEQVPPRPALPPLGFSPLQPGYVPEGYEYQGQSALAIRGKPAAHLRYSDGLNTISLFQQPGPPAFRESAGLRDMGFSQLVYRRVGEINVVVFADLPPDQLRRIVDSLPGG